VFILNVSSRLNPEGKKTTRSYKQGDNKQTNKKKERKKCFYHNSNNKSLWKSRNWDWKDTTRKKKVKS